MKDLSVVTTCCIAATLAVASGPASAATTGHTVATVCGGTPASYVLSLGSAQMLSAQSMSEAGGHAGPARSMTLARSHGWSPELWAWHQQVASGGVASARKDATVSVYDGNGRRLAQIMLAMAWPSKIASGATNAAPQQLQQTLTLSFLSQKQTCG